MYDNLTRKEIQLFINYKLNTSNYQKGIRYIYNIYYEMYLNCNFKPSSPLQAGLNITNACNLNCVHCSRKNSLSNDSVKNKPNMMTEWKKIVDKLAESQIVEIFLTGGEPLLHPDFFKIVEYIKSKKVCIGILTNGLLLNSDKIKRLSNILDENDYIQVSVDNLYDKYDLWRKGGKFCDIEKTIKLLNDYKVHFRIAMVISQDNYRDMIDMYLFCLENNVTEIKFMPLFETRFSNQIYPREDLVLKEFCKVLALNEDNANKISILQEPIASMYSFSAWLKKEKKDINLKTSLFFCPAMLTSCEISYDGYIYPCSYLDNQSFYCGNMLNEDIFDIWEKNDLFCKLHSKIVKNKKCITCIEKDVCQGGCSASSICSDNTFYSGDKRCLLIKSI